MWWPTSLVRTKDASRPTAELARARTCYDHLAGALGVALFDWLEREKAIEATSEGVVLARNADAVFGRLGVDPHAASRVRRRFTTACLDWTEKKTHLGGSLGASLCDALVGRGWVERQAGTRAVRVTPAGRRGLRRLGARV